MSTKRKPLPRRAVAPTEGMPTRRELEPVAKTITTPDLAGGGKLNPASFPGTSGVLPESERKPPKIRVVEEEVEEKEDEEKVVKLDWVEKQIRNDPSNLFLCAKLGADMRKKLSDFSRVFAADFTGVEVEDVDHVTMLFVQPEGGIDEALAERAYKATYDLVCRCKPVKARFQGWGYFDGARKGGKEYTALVALLDAPGLAEAHVGLKEKLSELGLPAQKQEHGYIPHATVAYLPKGSRVRDLPELGDEMVIEEVEVHHTTSRVVAFGCCGDSVSMSKALTLSPDMDVGELSKEGLLEAHWRLHFLLDDKREEPRGVKGMSVEDIVNLHAFVVDELFDRGVKHPPPPDNGLDERSEDFERNFERNTDHFTPPERRTRKLDGSEYLDTREKAYADAEGEAEGDDDVATD